MKLSRLGDVLDGIEAGRSFQTTDLAPRPGELGVLRVSSVTWGTFQPEEAKSVAGSYSPPPEHRVRCGDLLVSRANTKELVGAAVIVGRDYPLRLLSDKTLRLVLNESRIRPEYLLFALRSPLARAHIEGLATGTSSSMRNISQETLRATPIQLPPLERQRQIAASLQAQLAELEAARQAAEAQLREARALAERLLQAAFEDTQCELVRLGGAAQINPKRRAIVRREDELTSFLPMECVDGQLGTASPRLVPYERVKSGFTYIEEDDVIFAKITPCMQNGKHAIARALRGGLGFGSTEFHVVRPTTAIIPEWIWYFLRRRETIAAATKTFTGAVGQQRVPPTFLESLPIPLPPVVQQRRITARLQAQLAEVETARRAAEARLHEIEQLPQRILAQAFGDE